ncbi:clavesin-1-like [Anopheles nili]|uniref:clavesin-1-like n=1 Tax=Anopheles nili TaxID=185578 RepID=UPI00237A6C3C|nr:clavesin-1-like [Anopheles nili]
MSSYLRTFSVDKNPESCDEYKFTLPELYQELAKEKLREDDSVREQSLTEMRQWIVDNPHIRKCRTDAKFLLRFLRFRQFSVPMACEALERYLSIRALHPSLFEKLDCDEAIMKEILDCEPLSYLGQDHTGRAVFLLRFGQFNTEKHSPMHQIRYSMLMLETVLEWEEMQIGGFVLLIDYRDCSMDLFTQWSMIEMKFIADVFNGSYPVCCEQIHAAQLPKLAVPVIKVLLSFANPKLRETITCYSTIAELEKQFEGPLKPSLYDGEADLDELNRVFRKRIEDQRSIVLGLDDMEIDTDYYASVWDSKADMFSDAMHPEIVFKNLSID